jgi:single-strand DNA-binding protein
MSETQQEENPMNSVNLIGRLTKDPESHETSGGTQVTTIRLAVARPRRNGEDQAPVYVDVVTYGALAKPVADYMTQGRQVAVSGRLEYREWRDADDGFRSKHEVVADSVQFIDGKHKPAAADQPEPTEEPASVA